MQLIFPQCDYLGKIIRKSSIGVLQQSKDDTNLVPPQLYYNTAIKIQLILHID